MNTRDRLLLLAAEGRPADVHLPAAFFLHFPEDCHTGDAAVGKHIEYYRATGNDLMKVQYEHKYPLLEEIQRPEDWRKMPCYDESFYADQLDVVDGVVRELKKETVIIVTLYSPFMFAGHVVGKERLLQHFAENPDAVRRGLDTIVASMEHLIRGCIARGVDGFYASTQGGEIGRLPADVFDAFVRPTDLAVWDAFRDRTPFNVLHVCDYAAPYADFDRYVDYPGHIVSAPNEVGGRPISGQEISELFDRPFLGGMERLGVISNGPLEAIRREAAAAIESGPEAMILGADCTLAADTPWANIRAATDVAHTRRST